MKRSKNNEARVDWSSAANASRHRKKVTLTLSVEALEALALMTGSEGRSAFVERLVMQALAQGVDRREDERVAYIYGLFESDTSELRYIGRTSDLALRLSAHISHPRGRIGAWLLELGARNARVVMRALHVTTRDDAPYWERLAIEAFGDVLLNAPGTSF